MSVGVGAAGLRFEDPCVDFDCSQSYVHDSHPTFQAYWRERERGSSSPSSPPPPQTPVLCLYSSSQISLVYDSSRFIWPLIRQETAAREPASLILSHPHPRTALIFIYNCINDAIPVVLMVCLLRGKKTLAYIFGEETRLLYEICHVCHVRV